MSHPEGVLSFPREPVRNSWVCNPTISIPKLSFFGKSGFRKRKILPVSIHQEGLPNELACK